MATLWRRAESDRTCGRADIGPLPDLNAGRMYRLTYLLIVGLVLCGRAQAWEAEDQRTCFAGSARAAADTALAALFARDGEQLARLVSPDKGVRFSPGAFVDVDEDIVFNPNQIITFWTDPKIYHWGFEEGTGDEIRETPAGYATRYILDRDYLHTDAVYVNYDRGKSTTSSNIPAVYPLSTRVEYFVDTQEEENAELTDWASLRLVLEMRHGCWTLVGVIHDAWSP